MPTNNTVIRAGAQSAVFSASYSPDAPSFRNYRLDYTDWPKLAPGRLKDFLNRKYLKPGAVPPYDLDSPDYDGFALAAGEVTYSATALFDNTDSSPVFADLFGGACRTRLINVQDVESGVYPVEAVGTVLVERFTGAVGPNNNTMITVQVSYSASE